MLNMTFCNRINVIAEKSVQYR